MKKFYVNKVNETSADTLLAIGSAALLKQALYSLKKSSTGLLLYNAGVSFEITLPYALREEDLVSSQTIPFIEPLISTKQKEKGRILLDGFDYDRELEKQKQLSAQLKSLPANLRSPEAYRRKAPELESLLSDGPRPDLAHYRTINVMKVPDTFNDLVLRWQGLSASQQWLAIRLLFRLFSQPENNLEEAIQSWKKLAKEQGISNKTATAVQVINPTTGKGANTSKSYRPNSGGLDSFWLLELLKFKGFLIGAAPYMLRGSKDRKIFVIQPTKVAFDTLTSIMDDFRRICWSSTAIKQDILASLRLAQILVDRRHSELTIRQGLEDWEPSPIVGIAQGFDVTFYKDMGSAHATMNVATINIPTWFPSLATLEQVREADLLLEEHLRIIRRIEGHQGKEGSEEMELLQTYRDFLSGHDLRSFWQFAARYSCYLFRQRERQKDVKRWLPQLTKKGLDFLAMHHQNKSMPVSSILTNPGFEHIASAIREATVNAQRRRSQEHDETYEVRYGLDQELLRKAHYRDDFLIELNKFITLYNVETAREEEKYAKKALAAKSERKPKLRYPVTTADMQRFTELLDTYPTELIATMLIAYGTSRWQPLKQEELEAGHAADADLETPQEEE
jgi:hypothetical protein